MAARKVKNKLKQALLLRHMEQKALAEIIDVPKNYVSKIASGMNVKMDMALRICKALDLTLNDIFWIPVTKKK